MSLRSPRFAENPRLQRAALNSPPLHPGETGEAIEILQQALMDLGFSMPISMKGGRPNGIYNDETRAVLIDFHAAHGVPMDTLGGRNSFAALDTIFLSPKPTAVPTKGPHLRAVARTPLNPVHQLQGVPEETLGGRSAVSSLGIIFPIQRPAHAPVSGHKIQR